MQLNVEKKIRSNGEAALAYLDRYMISNLNTQTSKEDGVLKKLLSEGILKPSGKNWISLMTTSGAKGSMVSVLLHLHHSIYLGCLGIKDTIQIPVHTAYCMRFLCA
jgi:hypothetical protein